MLLRYKSPWLKWLTDHQLVDADELTLEALNAERTAYLIPDRAAAADETVRQWVELNYQPLFEHELGGWCDSPEQWPEERSLEQFDDWFDVECHSVVLDTLDEPIIEEDFEE